MPARAVTILVRLVVCCCLLATVPVYADILPVVVNGETQSIDLSGDTYLLEDPEGKLTLEDVRRPEIAKHFHRSAPKIGLSSSAWWLRISVSSASSGARTWWLDTGNRTLQEIELFIADENGIYQRHAASATLAFAERPLPFANFVFPITLASEHSVDVYLRIRSNGLVVVAVAPQLWAPGAYQAQVSTMKAQWIFYLGIAAALGMFNLLLYFSIRDNNYALYVLSLLSIVWSVCSVGGGIGAAYEYLWPGSPVFEQTAWVASILTASIFVPLFILHFTDMALHRPLLYRFIYLASVPVFAGLIARIVITALQLSDLVWLLPGAFIVSNVGGIVCLLAIIYGVAALAIDGNRSARFIGIAWLPFFSSMIFSTLSSLAGVRVGAPSVLMWGSTFELVFMSLALADRLNQEREAKARAQNALVEGLQKSERELEGKVAERTAEVKAQAAQLDEWNHTLEHRVQEQVQQIDQLGRLKRFFSPQLAEVIVAGGEEALKTHRREVSVVFIDLRGFTAFTDHAEPEEVMEMLHAFHGMMGKIVTEHSGTLERFAGDSMMIFFNDPVPVERHTEKAVHMALEMQQTFRQLGTEWSKRGYDLGLGCGIALGHATLGEIGYEGRWDYAAIGGVTNRAARLCAEAASGEVLVDSKVMEKVESLVTATSVGSLTLKGMKEPVPAFSLSGPMAGMR